MVGARERKWRLGRKKRNEQWEMVLKKWKRVESSIKRQVKKKRWDVEKKKMKRGRVRDTDVQWERWRRLSPFVFHMDSSLSVGLSFTLPRSLTLSLSCSHSLILFTPFLFQLLAFSPSLYLSPSLLSSPSLFSLPSPSFNSSFCALLLYCMSFFLSSLLCLRFIYSHPLFSPSFFFPVSIIINQVL